MFLNLWSDNLCDEEKNESINYRMVNEETRILNFDLLKDLFYKNQNWLILLVSLKLPLRWSLLSSL